MRILIEPSTYSCSNVGDAAMLQVCVKRLRRIWPAATIQVFTSAPDRLRYLCPGVEAMCIDGRQTWFANLYLLGRLRRWLPETMVRKQAHAQREIRRRWPILFTAAVRLKSKLHHHEREALDDFLGVAQRADVLVIGGMGGLTDAFERQALTILDLVQFLLSLGKPVIALGQGLGPITQGSELWRVASRTLPRLAFLALREGYAGLPLARNLGVPTDKLVVTGDDAIELAATGPATSEGRAIGVNVRVARYSGLSGDQVAKLQTSVRDLAAELAADLVPVPIAHRESDSDVVTLQDLLGGDGGAELDSPERIIAQVSRCRILVTGSYHAGVFALSQGIPVIALTAAPYYTDKFLGLADQFGGHCTVVDLTHNCAMEQLHEAALDAWNQPAEARDTLKQRAREQVETSRQAYERAAALIADTLSIAPTSTARPTAIRAGREINA